MNPRTTTEDPRYKLARHMRSEGHSMREIAQVLGVRWQTCSDWVKDVHAPVVKKSRPQRTPEPYITGYRWFSCKWY